MFAAQPAFPRRVAVVQAHEQRDAPDSKDDRACEAHERAATGCARQAAHGARCRHEALRIRHGQEERECGKPEQDPADGGWAPDAVGVPPGDFDDRGAYQSQRAGDQRQHPPRARDDCHPTAGQAARPRADAGHRRAPTDGAGVRSGGRSRGRRARRPSFSRSSTTPGAERSSRTRLSGLCDHRTGTSATRNPS